MRHLCVDGNSFKFFVKRFVSFALTANYCLAAGSLGSGGATVRGVQTPRLRPKLRGLARAFLHTRSQVFRVLTRLCEVCFDFPCCVYFWLLGFGDFYLFSSGNFGDFLFIIDVLKFHRNS